MNDDALSPEALASGYVDGELTADQRAVVDADPALRELVDAHAAVRDAVAEPPTPLSVTEREHLVLTALAAAPATTAGVRADGGTVVPLRPRRTRRRWVTIAAGVAAGAAAVLAIGLVLRSGHSGTGTNSAGGANVSSAEAASAASEAPGTAGAAAPLGPAASTTEAPATEAADSAARDASGGFAATASTTTPPAPAGAAPATTAAAAPPTAIQASGLADLGPLATRPQFIEAARPFKLAVSGPGAGPCAAYPPPLATATYQGTPAYLVVVEVSPNGNRVALVAIDTCAVLVKVDLAEVS